ncbi:MAG: hypothetical protein M3483_02330 [Gemmatimonadota bacterium]|nr:hypothetical protein [Gemmatimonadota bacterium]
MENRRFPDDEGRLWEAVAVPRQVAHLKEGAALAFRPAEDPAAALLPTEITFNSMAAAATALATMGEKELQRRLEWAQVEAGRV